MTIAEVKNNLTGMLHGGSLDDVKNLYSLMERVSNVVLSHLDPIETEREAALASLIYDDIYNYALASDYKKLIDLRPQDNRQSLDSSSRGYAERFDLQKAIKEKTISIEGRDGTKFIRINWRTRSPKLLHNMNSLTANGTWSASGTSTGLKAQTLFKISGNASIEFDMVATGDGIQNTTMSVLNLTNEDEVADVFVWIYLPSAPTSISALWGNDLTTKYWTGVAQTAQADGTAFKTGWNLIRFPWSTATETGTVAPATIDSFRLTITSSALSNIRVDEIVFVVGRNFDTKYYSSYAFKNSAGIFIAQPTTDSDELVLASTSLQIWMMEAIKAVSQQLKGKDAEFDVQFANQELHGDPRSPDPVRRMGLYASYRKEYPSQAKKAVTQWSNPRWAKFSQR